MDSGEEATLHTIVLAEVLIPNGELVKAVRGHLDGVVELVIDQRRKWVRSQVPDALDRRHECTVQVLESDSRNLRVLLLQLIAQVPQRVVRV